MQKTNKIYLAVVNPIVTAMNKAPSECLSAFKDKLRNSNGQLKGENYEKYRRYIKSNFLISKCDSWFMANCIEYLNMDYTQFSKDPISQETMSFISKLGLKKKSNK